MDMAPHLPGPFWLVGCGNMAGAMLDRWLAVGIDRSQITVIRPSGGFVAEGVRVLTAYPSDETPFLVMLGVKPQKIDEVTPLLAPILDPHTIVISLLAGVELESLRARFPAPRTIFRAMPNMPVKLGKGVINLIGNRSGDAENLLIEALMKALGTVERFDDEQKFQAAGVLTGAGPAFVFRFIDALAKAGEAVGLSPDQAERLAVKMVEGAGALAASEKENPATLARQVASPGGTTRAGLDILDADEALDRLVRQTLAAGLRRSIEMAEAARSRTR
jgi:pyrroline-5-carboxylate reductase